MYKDFLSYYSAFSPVKTQEKKTFMINFYDKEQSEAIESTVVFYMKWR